MTPMRYAADTMLCSVQSILDNNADLGKPDTTDKSARFGRADSIACLHLKVL